MPTESQRVARQMQLALEGPAWHGPSLQEIVTGVNAETASAKPVAGAHSIWEIVMHLIATQRIILRRLEGDTTALNVPVAVEWPACPPGGEASWQETLRMLAEGEQALRARVAAFPADRLDQPLIPGGSSAYDNFHGHVQHNLYHASQIGLLKKMQASR